ncbi:MAG: hypothetical protein IPQ08_09185 [Chitinophagaceae bacterium]|nr:hypothetical protein [Chitinophagaceae bacterium]
MSIRPIALKWFKEQYGETPEHISSTKFYTPDISWPRTNVWWPKFPVTIFEDFPNGHVHILCQKEPNGNSFHYLKVPVSFLKEHRDNFHTLNGKHIDLSLSAEERTLFREGRGKVSLDFSQFLL